jgi:Protein of unknown function (DUF3795)
MKTNESRREFLAKGSRMGLICGALAGFPKLLPFGSLMREDEILNPKKLNYCGYACPPDCPMKKATLENNVELKKEAYKNWRIENKYGLAFDPDKIFCYGCKTPERSLGLVVEKCSVRNCAIENRYDCCIECPDLTACDKEIWITFPDFHKKVIEMQQKYREAKGRALD